MCRHYIERPNECLRIVSRAQGSWKWQKRFALVRYGQRVTKDKRLVWVSMGAETRDFASTKATADIFAAYPMGSLHNKPVGNVPRIEENISEQQRQA